MSDTDSKPTPPPPPASPPASSQKETDVATATSKKTDESDEPKTAFNSPTEEVKFEDTYKDSLFTVVDPFKKDESAPWDNEDLGFQGTDPTLQHVSEARNPDPKAHGTKNLDPSELS